MTKTPNPFTGRELAAVVAGLRLVQRQHGNSSYPRDIAAIEDRGGEFVVLSDDEIDDLCVRLNCGTEDPAGPSGIDELLADGFTETALGGNLTGWHKGGALVTYREGEHPGPGAAAEPAWLVGHWPQREVLVAELCGLEEAIAIASVLPPMTEG